jgi:transposase
MIEVVTVDALSTIALLVAIEALYPAMRIIHVFLDNVRYHHARAVQEWLARPGRRIRLHFVPAYCPHLSPIERLWGLMHKNVTHNRCHATYNGFCEAVLGFLRRDVPSRWSTLCDRVTDNFRIISPGGFSGSQVSRVCLYLNPIIYGDAGSRREELPIDGRGSVDSRAPRHCFGSPVAIHTFHQRHTTLSQRASNSVCSPSERFTCRPIRSSSRSRLSSPSTTAGTFRSELIFAHQINELAKSARPCLAA